MSTFVRGINPLWSYVDLTGLQFDDTYYMFVLQNTLPYIPVIVYHDPNGNVPWTNPVQFLANGTLPTDIYFDPDQVYRLEFRKGPTQSDPLIYPVNNYQPDGNILNSGDNTSFTTDNQISNPQFSLVNFNSPLILTGLSDPDPIQIGPGWFLNLVGSGNVTLNQQPLNNSSTTINPTNAPYALEIILSGTWSSAYISQRFQQNGMLWANKTVSSSITALMNGAPQSISAILVDSNGTTLGEVLNPVSINSSFNEYKDYAILGPTTNPNVPPNAYIDYRLILPTSVDIFFTSIQLVSGDLQIEYEYLQDTIDRQIDHTYHSSYPIVPIGTIIFIAGFTASDHYLLCNGASINRITYQQLFNQLTTTETITLTMGLATFTVSSTINYSIGMSIEGMGVPFPTTIANISGTTITMSNVATLSGSSLITFFSDGNGDGSTTFNVPNIPDYVIAGANGSLFPNQNGPGAKGGSATTSLTEGQLAPHVHEPLPSSTGYIGPKSSGGTLQVTGTVSNNAGVAPTTASTGNGDPISLVQQTYFSRAYIRFE